MQSLESRRFIVTLGMDYATHSDKIKHIIYCIHYIVNLKDLGDVHVQMMYLSARLMHPSILYCMYGTDLSHFGAVLGTVSDLGTQML